MDLKSLTSWGLKDNILEIIENGFSYDEETGEVLFTADDLEALEERFDEKLNNICGYITASEDRAASLKKRKEEIDKNIKVQLRKAESLKKYLLNLMQASNITKKELTDYNLGTRKSSSVEILNEDAVYEFLDSHPEYAEACKKVETKTTLVKTGLKEILKEQTVPGAQIVEKTSVSIK